MPKPGDVTTFFRRASDWLPEGQSLPEDAWLAQTLNLETVAEGVEQPEPAALLGELGCELAQGYHFAKPLTVEAVDTLAGGHSTGGLGRASTAERGCDLDPGAGPRAGSMTP